MHVCPFIFVMAHVCISLWPSLSLYWLNVCLELMARRNICITVSVCVGPSCRLHLFVYVHVFTDVSAFVDSNEGFGVCCRWRVYHDCNPSGEIFCCLPSHTYPSPHSCRQIKCVVWNAVSFFKWKTLCNKNIVHFFYLVYPIVCPPNGSAWFFWPLKALWV